MKKYIVPVQNLAFSTSLIVGRESLIVGEGGYLNFSHVRGVLPVGGTSVDLSLLPHVASFNVNLHIS